jgi:hypothetical protein
MISTATKTVVTIAGSAKNDGFVNGDGASARFRAPAGLSVDHKRNVLFIADSGNNAIRYKNILIHKKNRLSQ